MKTKTKISNKKLVLSKKTVARLDNGDLKKVKGGGIPWIDGIPWVEGIPWIDFKQDPTAFCP